MPNTIQDLYSLTNITKVIDYTKEIGRAWGMYWEEEK